MSALDRINHQLECHAEASSTLLSDIFERLKALEAQFADFRAHNSAISRQEAQTGNNVVLEKQVEIEVLADDQEKSCDGVSCQPDRPPPHIECRYHIDAITTSEQSEALQGLVHKLQEELQQTAMVIFICFICQVTYYFYFSTRMLRNNSEKRTNVFPELMQRAMQSRAS